jgi:hypothetical protein
MQGNAGMGPQSAGRDQLGAGNALRRLLNGSSGGGAAGGGSRPFASLGEESVLYSIPILASCLRILAMAVCAFFAILFH